MFSRSVVSDFVTPWTVACQASLSMGFPRQKDWSTGIEPTSAAPALLGGFITTVPPGKPMKRFAKIWMKLSIWPGFQPPTIVASHPRHWRQHRAGFRGWALESQKPRLNLTSNYMFSYHYWSSLCSAASGIFLKYNSFFSLIDNLTTDSPLPIINTHTS